MISGVKGFLVRMTTAVDRMTTAVDLKIGCVLWIPPKYYVNMFFFLHMKNEQMSLSFSQFSEAQFAL